MPNLSAVDWMIPLIYFFFAISIALGLRQFIANSGDFLLGGRVLPAWLCGFAFAAASLGSLDVLGMGAAGARYGMPSASFFGLGSVVPLLFTGLFLMPVYSSSKARSMPGYLGLRFDGKTRQLAAILFLATTILYAALSLYVMARVFTALGVFNVLFHAQTVGSRGILIFSAALPAALVLIFVLLGGLSATMYTQVMQYFMLIAGFLPIVLLGLKQIGGWSQLKSGFLAATTHATGSAPPTGIGAVAVATGLGMVLTAGYWCTDMSLLQTALAAKNARAARRAPLIAAAARVFLPFLLVVPGMIAMGLPTPHTVEVVRNENGAIYHEINVVPEPAEQGQGVVPARTDSLTDPMGGKILRDAAGHPLLDYAMAIPNLLPYNLPTGLIGLAITALLACLTGGVAARISALGTIFTFDLYEPRVSEETAEKHTLAVARWTTLAAVIVSTTLACLAMFVPMPGLLDLLALAFALFWSPMLMTFLLGMFSKRLTGHGAFAGLIAGFAAALAHHGLTLPAGAMRGFAGGWIAVLHHPVSGLAQNVGTALCGILANLVVTIVVSLFTAARPESELAGLVYSRIPAGKPESRIPPGKAARKSAAGFGATAFALSILAAAIAVSLIFL